VHSKYGKYMVKYGGRKGKSAYYKKPYIFGKD
jgi:hypothetical protein